jgi:hypothetical protein
MAALAEPEEVRAHLIAAACAGESLTYAGLLELLGFPFSRPRMRQLCALLGEADAIGAALGEPPLAVLVVRQSDGLPGQGWWIGAARDHDYAGPWEGPQARALVTALQQEAFRFWSENGTVRPRDAR